MREILLTSSVLILALLALRRVFREKIARRVQYALWALVLVRLLVPVSLPALDFSVLTMAEPVQETISQRLEAPAFTAPALPTPNVPSQQSPSPYPAAVEPAIPGAVSAPQQTSIPSEAPAAKQLTLTEILGIVWLSGTAVMAVWLLASNLSFARKLCRSRVPVNIPGAKYRVYMVESGLASPCLFGILRPAIYLTPVAVRSEASLRHVLAHEETHARHLDPLWSLLRSVCLAIYWFNPLVWIAASASKTDCELACDEGAIRRLGEGERLAYGKTLLSLIPIRRLPGNPLLSATTMSSDKKRLRDRITRIAENRQTRKLALCAMALLTAGACVLTFAGCSEGAAKDTPTEVEKEDGPITAAELRYFNENFFNGTTANIHNQFLSSMYETAADIDLFELFYTGIGAGEGMTDAERDAYEAANGFVDCDIVKLTPAGIDKVLLENTGLTLEEIGTASLENGFTYLPEYNAYYNGHGDTNYRMNVVITAGERKDGLLRLYYNDTFMADGWKCVSLRETENSYQFVSNAYSEKPVVPTVYPAGNPLLTIPLSGLTGTEPQTSYMEHHSGDCEEALTGYGRNWDVWGHHVQGYRSTNGTIYVAEVTEAQVSNGEMTVWEADCFAVMPNEDFYMDLFTDLFGRDGFVTYYTDYEHNTPYLDYWAFDEDGTLVNLVSFHSDGAGVLNTSIIDMDGDGVNELVVTDGFDNPWLFFQRDGMIYEADINALVREAWVENLGLFFNGLDPYARCLPLLGYVDAAGNSGEPLGLAAFRSIYFDGENLLVYKTDKTAVDHITPGVTAPADVMDTLRQAVQDLRDERVLGEGLRDAGIDDWRIISVTGPWREEYGGLTVEIYRYNYELHAAAPENVMWVAGIYVDEDGWVSPGYPDCDYAYFRLEPDGSRTYLYTDMQNDMGPDGERFHGELESALVQRDLLEADPGDTVQAMWAAMRDNKDLTLTLETVDGGGSYSASMGWNSPYDLTSDYTWERLEEAPLFTRIGYLIAYSPANNTSLAFHIDTQFVSCTIDHETTWYRVEYTGQEDVFACEMLEWFRRFYDEAELSTLQASIPTIPDDGRSREEIARAWVEAYEGAHLNATSGSIYKCTYMDIRDVDLHLWDEVDLTEYKASRGAEDVFLFNYSAVFVPEGEPHWFMAGNTAGYEGTNAPEGALEWWRLGYMYLLEDGWHCDGSATGP